MAITSTAEAAHVPAYLAPPVSPQAKKLCHTQLSEYLVLPEILKPKRVHHLHTRTSQEQTQGLQASLRSKLQWTTPHAEVEIKLQFKPGAVWLRKKTHNLPTKGRDYKLGIKSTGSTRQTLCLWNI